MSPRTTTAVAGRGPAPGTQTSDQKSASAQRKQIKRIEKAFGDFPIKALDDLRATSVFLEWRDQLAQTSLRQADYAYGTLARILSWAKKRRLITENPCANGRKLYHQIITAMAKAVLKSDYFIESDIAGTVQALFIADGAEAKNVADQFPHGAQKKGDGKPATLVFSTVVDAQRAEALARKLKLL